MSREASPEDDGVAFTLALGRALQTYGTPAHRLEEAMRDVVDTLGIEGEFFSTPTVILASLGTGAAKRTHLIRIESTSVDLGKMAALGELVTDVVSGQRSPAAASEQLDEILASPDPYSPAVTMLSFAISSAAASTFFGSGWREVFLAFAAGLTVGALALLATRRTWLGRLFDPLAGFLVSFIATTGSVLLAPASAAIVTVAGLIALVPGFTLTVAINELAQRSLISGAARLHGALVLFLMLGFGVAVGGSLGSLLAGGVANPEPIALPSDIQFLAVVIAACTLTVLFRAPRRYAPAIILASLLTYLTVRGTSNVFGPELGVFAGAVVAGVASNLHARAARCPAAITRVPAMMLLVPGGLGFLSISSLMEQNVVEGLETAFSVAIMAVALVTGLLISNAIVSPGKKL